MTAPVRLSVAVAVALASLASGGAWAAPRGAVVEFGRTEGDSTRSGPPEDAGNGLAPARPMTNRRFVAHTDVIEARLCASFGITVRLSGTPMPDKVDVRVIHPRFTTPDGETSLEDDFPGDVLDGTAGVGFTFDHLWEMQPGPWRIVVSADGVELASQAFTVVPNPPGAPKTDCHGGIET